MHGGFGAAPKFPHATELDLCLRHYALQNDPRSREIVEVSLSRMADGGIYDQLGGRLLPLQRRRRVDHPAFREDALRQRGAAARSTPTRGGRRGQKATPVRAKGIVGWLLVEMRSPERGFYSSLDADSEHEEGKFYVWTPDEVRALLDGDEYVVAAAHWGLDRSAEFRARNVAPARGLPLADVARTLSMALPDRRGSHRPRARQAARGPDLRVRPGRDEKLLTSWNALMIAALARAGRIFDQPAWLAAAREAADFIRATMWRDGKLLATYKDGRAHLERLSGRPRVHARGADRADAELVLSHAISIGPPSSADSLLARFEDAAGGGFFFTSHDHEALIHRPKPGHDNATPAGNGIAAQALTTLGHWLSSLVTSTRRSGRSGPLLASLRASRPVSRRSSSRSMDAQGRRRPYCFAATRRPAWPGSARSNAAIGRPSKRSIYRPKRHCLERFPNRTTRTQGRDLRRRGSAAARRACRRFILLAALEAAIQGAHLTAHSRLDRAGMPVGAPVPWRPVFKFSRSLHHTHRRLYDTSFAFAWRFLHRGSVRRAKRPTPRSTTPRPTR